MQRLVALAADHARARSDCLLCPRKTFESPYRSYGFFSRPSPQGSYGTGSIWANPQQFVATGPLVPYFFRLGTRPFLVNSYAFLQSVRTFPSLLESRFLLARIADQIIHSKALLALEGLVRFERLFSLDRRSKAAPVRQIPKLLRTTGSRRSGIAFVLFLLGLEPHCLSLSFRVSEQRAELVAIGLAPNACDYLKHKVRTLEQYASWLAEYAEPNVPETSGPAIPFP